MHVSVVTLLLQELKDGAVCLLLRSLVKFPKIMIFCSLLCRTFDAALAECCHLERVGLLGYSPLAMGLLTVLPYFPKAHCP
jgi:hypothetical protein